jgi:hypothetical protein
MQMIDVLKRLAELDANNPNIIKESQTVEECGPMGMMDSMGMDKPSTPASMNITAGSGDELANMLATIMQLAGVKEVGANDINQPEGGNMLTAEPEIEVDVEPMGSTDDMRSMIDKLNPMDDEGGDDVSKAHGDFDNDGDHDMDDHEKEKEEETDEAMYSNSPQRRVEGPGAFAAHGDMDKNPAGGGDVPKDHESRPRVRNQPTATFENLMSEYEKFVSEGGEKTMSRAAKGYEKYGKKGMMALAKAGKDGKDLDKVRDKYNKYD